MTLSPATYRDTLATVRTINESFFDLRADYDAAQENRFYTTPAGTPIHGATADWHWRNESDYFKVLERCRGLVRNDKIVAQGMRTLVRNVIQDGFKLQAATQDDALNATLDQRWADWAGDKSRVDYRGELDWHWIEKIGAAAVLGDGDFSINPLSTGALQVFEAHRMRSPSGVNRLEGVFGGVQRGANERRSRYWITRGDYDGVTTRIFKITDLSPFNAYAFNAITQRPEDAFFHVRVPARFTQTRGVSPLCPVVITAGMLSDIDFAALVKQQITNYFAIFRQVPESFQGELQSGTEEEDPYGDGTRFKIPIAPGAELQSRTPGEKLEGFAPNIPGPQYFEHSHMLLGYIATNLDLPLILLMMDASETNFSGWRGSFDQAKLRFKDFQRSYASMLHMPVRRWKILQWLAQDASLRRRYEVMGEDLFSCECHFPRWPFVQPLDDIAADVLEVRNGLTSYRRLCLGRNVDYDDLSTEIIDDAKLIYRKAMLAAQELNAEFPEAHVDWREVYYPPQAEAVQVSLQPLNQANQQQAQGVDNGRRRNRVSG